MTPAEFKQIRIHAGLSQKQFAEAIGITERTVRRWEKQSGDLDLRKSILDKVERISGEI